MHKIQNFWVEYFGDINTTWLNFTKGWLAIAKLKPLSLSTRVAGLGRLSAGVKNAIIFFVNRVFTNLRQKNVVFSHLTKNSYI